MYMNDCSINSTSKTKDFTCLTKNELIIIAKSMQKDTLNTANLNKKSIYSIIKIKTNLDEDMWYKIKDIPEEIKILLYVLFKPRGPTRGFAWLDNKNISDTMYNYSYYINKHHTPFYFFDAIPADYFDKNSKKILEIKQIARNKLVAIVFNTDIAKNPGSHWVSLCLKDKVLYYFDPTGNSPNIYIKHFIDKFHGYKKIINTREYQTRDGTCGLWSILFILKLVVGKKISSKYTDMSVNILRKTFFSRKS